ncbi:Hpt domain-containing protein [Neptunicoccus sediminis]|uniref:Hpt domain-containing protein n=1 Tax=Neptunicoccus sediminis TaxID=1892596 RepID=UPI0009F3320D|nr:Hpt domain-containing protein [Neptunicoccus sediminis]
MRNREKVVPALEKQRQIKQILTERFERKTGRPRPLEPTSRDLLAHRHLVIRSKGLQFTTARTSNLMDNHDPVSGVFHCKINAAPAGESQRRPPLLCQIQLSELKHVFGAEGLSERLESFLAEGDRITETIAHLTARRQFSTLQAAAHKFGGSCALFGAKDLLESLTQLELACTRNEGAKVNRHVIHTQSRWLHTKDAMQALPYFR